uniref:Uncharacterized protein n=1 Tax=Sclerotinia sclerotiorum alphaflexivirus 1 TaxID=2879903 RepID=A0A8K1J9Y4_9VIRU|nr:hypothetical protein 1 [Sclerotinia sclerotiorum alphaflexivirus 1]
MSSPITILSKPTPSGPNHILIPAHSFPDYPPESGNTPVALSGTIHFKHENHEAIMIGLGHIIHFQPLNLDFVALIRHTSDSDILYITRSGQYKPTGQPPHITYTLHNVTADVIRTAARALNWIIPITHYKPTEHETKRQVSDAIGIVKDIIFPDVTHMKFDNTLKMHHDTIKIDNASGRLLLGLSGASNKTDPVLLQHTITPNTTPLKYAHSSNTTTEKPLHLQAQHSFNAFSIKNDHQASPLKLLHYHNPIPEAPTFRIKSPSILPFTKLRQPLHNVIFYNFTENINFRYPMVHTDYTTLDYTMIVHAIETPHDIALSWSLKNNGVTLVTNGPYSIPLPTDTMHTADTNVLMMLVHASDTKLEMGERGY